MPRHPTTMWNLRRDGWQTLPGHKKAEDWKYLEVDDFRKLLQTTREDTSSHHAETAYHLFVIAGNFGLRCIECLRIQFDDLAPLKRRADYFVVHSAKKGAVVDEPVWVGDSEREALIQIYTARKVLVRGTHLFEMPERSVRHIFAWYMRAARLSPNISFHALRHTAAKLINRAANGNPLYGAVRLRHRIESMGVIAGYARPTKTDMIVAANRKGVIL